MWKFSDLVLWSVNIQFHQEETFEKQSVIMSGATSFILAVVNVNEANFFRWVAWLCSL